MRNPWPAPSAWAPWSPPRCDILPVPFAPRSSRRSGRPRAPSARASGPRVESLPVGPALPTGRARSGPSLEQLLDLPRPQFPDLARLKALERKRPDADASDFLHQNADALEHSVDLPIPALDQGDLVPRLPRRLDQSDRLGPGHAPVQLDPVPELLHRAGARPAAYLHFVSLRHLVLGCQNSIRKVPVVGQYQQTLRVVVQTANRKEAP